MKKILFLSLSIMILFFTVACSSTRESLWVREDIDENATHHPPKCIDFRAEDIGSSLEYKIAYAYINESVKKAISGKCPAYLRIRKTRTRIYFSSMLKKGDKRMITISYSIKGYMKHRKDIVTNQPLTIAVKDNSQNMQSGYPTVKEYYESFIKDMSYTFLVHIGVFSIYRPKTDVSYTFKKDDKVIEEEKETNIY